MADKRSPSRKAADAVALRPGFLPYSRYDASTGALIDPPGTTVFSRNGPVQRNLRRVLGRPEETPTLPGATSTRRTLHRKMK